MLDRTTLKNVIAQLSLGLLVVVGACLLSVPGAAAKAPKPPKQSTGKSYSALAKPYKKLTPTPSPLLKKVGNPSGNLSPNPDFSASCAPFVDYDNSDACTGAALAAINNAQRLDEGIGPMPLNLANFEQLTPPEQMFVVTNLERQERGLPPIAGMTAQLNGMAYQGALNHKDPKFTASSLTGGIDWIQAESNWAGGYYNALASDYVYMYEDGCPGTNGDCNLNPPQPWGHRKNIVDDYSGGYCSGGGLAYMGAANVSGQSMAQIMVGTCSTARPTDVTFTWQQAQILLSCSPVNGTTTLGTNQLLCPNQALVSPNGQYSLVLQTDGNVVLYNGAHQTVWSTNTSGTAAGYLIMRADGNLILNNAADNDEWQSNTYGRGGVRITLQNDGNLVMFNAQGQAVWSSQGGLVLDPPVLYANQRLYVNQYLDSPSGRYTLTMQPDGNLVEYDGPNAIWQSHTYGAPAAYVQLMFNGNLEMHATNGSLLWQSRTFGIAPNGSLNLQDDSNLVLKTAGGSPIWSIDTGFIGQSSLTPMQTLNSGQCLVSSSAGAYRLCMQPDGNLVLYNTLGSPVWYTNTEGTGASYLIMQPDNNLVLYTAAGQPVWYTNTEGTGANDLIMQTDGNLVLYAPGARPVWYSNTEGR